MKYKTGEISQNQDKSDCLMCDGNHSNMDVICVAQRGRNRKQAEYIQELEESQVPGKTNAITTVQKDNLIIQRQRGKNGGGTFAEKAPTMTSNAYEQNNLVVSGTLRTFKDDYGFREIKSGKGGAVCARAREDGSGQNVCKVGERIRRLTPTECARLQTIPDWYKWQCSETQQYKMLGNGWTVEVIKHIFSFIPNELRT